MARFTRQFRLRLYGKKRGHRRTGSRQLASAGEALFFGVLLLVGAVGLSVMLIFWVLPHWEANYNYVSHVCKVVEQKRIEHDDKK